MVLDDVGKVDDEDGPLLGGVVVSPDGHGHGLAARLGEQPCFSFTYFINPKKVHVMVVEHFRTKSKACKQNMCTMTFSIKIHTHPSTIDSQRSGKKNYKC